jgi:hypothetical protein
MTDMYEPHQWWVNLLPTGDSQFCLSFIALHGSKYHVQNSERKEVAVVNSIDDTRPALLNYYMDNPRWHRASSTQYFKFTRLGLVQVERNGSGQWVAYCNLECLLGRDGEPAIFTARKKAQCAAEKHLFDELARLLPSEDGRLTSTVTTQ